MSIYVKWGLINETAGDHERDNCGAHFSVLSKISYKSSSVSFCFLCLLSSVRLLSSACLHLCFLSYIFPSDCATTMTFSLSHTLYSPLLSLSAPFTLSFSSLYDMIQHDATHQINAADGRVSQGMFTHLISNIINDTWCNH